MSGTLMKLWATASLTACAATAYSHTLRALLDCSKNAQQIVAMSIGWRFYTRLQAVYMFQMQVSMRSVNFSLFLITVVYPALSNDSI